MDGGDDLLGAGVDDLKGLAVDARDELVIDEEAGGLLVGPRDGGGEFDKEVGHGGGFGLEEALGG